MKKIIATLLIGFDDPIEKDQKNHINTDIQTITSPISGQLVKLEDVNDETFSSESVGKGIAIVPNSGKVYAPVDGTITATFETKHAIGMVSDTGIELLIHVGIDAISLEGECFKSYVEKGNNVKKGDLLLEFDLEGLKKSGVDPTTMIVVTNSNQYLEIIPTKEKKVSVKDNLLTII